MPIVDLQRRYRELGRIRLGEKGANGQPVKRSTFRLTSPTRLGLDAAATVYGGTVREWKGAPGQGKQWELCTDVDTLDVFIAPGTPATQWWEMWSGGGCVRRCTGARMVDDEPCACPVDIDERLDAGRKGKACLPYTRLSVMLGSLPDLGTWRCETHGRNAAEELPKTIALLERALDQGALVQALLRIEQRTSKVAGEGTRHYVVPVLELPSITLHALMSGDMGPLVPSIGGPATGALPPSAPALPASSAPAPTPTPRPVVPEPERPPVEVVTDVASPVTPPPLPGEEPAPKPARAAAKKAAGNGSDLHAAAAKAGLSDRQVDALVLNLTDGDFTSTGELGKLAAAKFRGHVSDYRDGRTEFVDRCVAEAEKRGLLPVEAP